MLLTPTTISPVVKTSPVKLLSLPSLPISKLSTAKPAYLVNVDTPVTSKSVTLYVPSTLRFPSPLDSVPMPTAPSFKLNDPIPIR